MGEPVMSTETTRLKLVAEPCSERPSPGGFEPK